MRVLLLWLLCLLCSASGCYPGDLKIKQEEIGTITDVAGTFCTENPEDLDYPVKVLFILDSSGSMRYSDAEQMRVAAVREVIHQSLDAENYYFALMLFSSDLLILTPPDDPYTNEAPVLDAALAAIPTGAGSTNYSAALSQAYTLIQNDIRAHPNEAERTTYVTVFLSDGVPTDGMGEAHYLGLVNNIAGLENQRPGCMRSVVNTAYLQNGAVDETAYTLLQNMAATGGGSFQSFADSSEIDFTDIDLSYTTRTYAMWNLLVSNRMVLPTLTGITVDSDGDGLSDEYESQIGSNPLHRDTDGDGCSDVAEQQMSWPLDRAPDPSDPDHCICPEMTASQDSDLDGLNDCEEQFLLTFNTMPDTDLDGFTDWVETVVGTYPTVVDDLRDSDLDLVANGEEIREHRSILQDDADVRAEFAYVYDTSSRTQSGDGIRCYDIEVNNIALLPTVATDDHAAGVNLIDIYVAQTPSDLPGTQILYRKFTASAAYPGSEADLNPGSEPTTIAFTSDQFDSLF